MVKISKIQIAVTPETRSLFYEVHYELVSRHKVLREVGQWTMEDTLRYLLDLYLARRSAESYRTY